MDRIEIGRRTLLTAKGATLLAGRPAHAAAQPVPVGRPAPQSEKVLKVGVLGVMRGPAASWGLVNKYCAEITAQMYNEQGGVDVGGSKYRIDIITINDQLDPERAVAGAEELLRQGIHYIIGPNIDTTAAVVVPLLRSGNAINVAYAFAKCLYTPPQRNSILGMVASYQDGPTIYRYLRDKRGMGAITVFIDWAGPGVYAVMFMLTAWIIYKARWHNISFTLAEIKYSGWGAFWEMVVATALVVSYFSGPMVNFSDFSRFATDMGAVRTGNFWGLPVNFLAFSIVTVVTTSGTFAVFGQYIGDPVEIVARIDSTAAAVLGAATFLIATISINIVANFVSPAFDFSNVSPRHITFIRGGMIAAVGSVAVMPWHLFNSPHIIHYTLDTLGAAIGPLYGILVCDYHLLRHEHLFVDDLYNDKPDGHYWYQGGFNPNAVWALVVGAVAGMVFVIMPMLHGFAAFTWFVGVLVGGGTYWALMRRAGTDTARTERAHIRLAQS